MVQNGQEQKPPEQRRKQMDSSEMAKDHKVDSSSMSTSELRQRKSTTTPSTKRVSFNKKQNHTTEGSMSSSVEDDGSPTKDHANRRNINNKNAFGNNRLWWIIAFIIVLGCATAAALLAIGLTSATDDQTELFQGQSEDLVTQIQRSWNDYVTAAAWVHGRCRNRDFTRADFRRSYEYLVGSGLDFQAVQFDPNVTRDQRPAYEAEARQFYADNYPSIEYRGFVGFEYDNSTTLEPRSEQDFYFPIHYMEPVDGNVAAIDLDYHSSGSRKRTVLHCMSAGQPGLTDRLRLVQETTESAYGVVLMHPGYDLTDTSFQYEASSTLLTPDQVVLSSNNSSQNLASNNSETQQSSPGSGSETETLVMASTLQEDDVWPRDLASIVIRIPDLIERAAGGGGDSLRVYLYDTSDTTTSTEDTSDGYVFLGAAELTDSDIIFLPETSFTDLRKEIEELYELYHEEPVDVANKRWVVVVHSVPGSYEPQIAFVVLGGVIIFVASLCVAYWMYYNSRRMTEFQNMQAAAEAEKAALVLDSARQATRAERELNDFIAHEVRNPVAAAMSACSFVKAAVEETEPLRTESQRQETIDDVYIIDNALRFVNDLLRNMLDMHRAANKQLKVNMTPTDILHDVIESVQAMLPQRETKFAVEVDCPEGLVAMTDRLRLKQVVLNLARNSVKFIHEGFIRLRADVVNEEVCLYIEDSGPGIPEEKRQILFNKFQESLDSLSQGTGIGLFLCKNLVDLMEGEIYLDESYDSGVPGSPGSRFVVNLKRPQIGVEAIHDYHASSATKATDATPDTHVMDAEEELSSAMELPESLSVLFVDDDPILRKLFRRTLLTVAPGWKIREAANGETALKLVETETFDLIFMDMYMASVEKQLLGTEAVLELRRRGVECRICGLSANDKESEFLDAGADSFSFKPFPCEAVALTQELCRILYAKDQIADNV